MAKRPPYLQHLKSADDLVTTYGAIRAGFVSLALERNRRATPYVEQARALKVAASQVANPAELLNVRELQPAILAAAGVSDKAAGHLQAQDKLEAIQGLIRNFLEPAGANFVEELVFRFLLTRGDTLGGLMRNVGGVLAQRKLTRAIISTLTLSGVPYHWMHAATSVWAAMSDDDADIEIQLRGLNWQKGRQQRTLLFNLTVPFVKSNVDVCLFNLSPQKLSAIGQVAPTAVIAMGELKGGIDPAGADEHWKTARTALTRIQQAFATSGHAPQTFFIGAAIEKRMAIEIWEQLEGGSLSNAANMTDAEQVSSLARWLCSL